MPSATNLATIGDRIERLLDNVRVGADPSVYAHVQELVRQVTELYGAGLARIVDVVGADAPASMMTLLDDELVSSLLVMHDLHPDNVTARVERALASVRPFLGQHGGDVELVDIDVVANAVLLRLLGSCDGGPSSAVTLQHAVERAVRDAAPEIEIIDVEQPVAAGVSTPVSLGTKPQYDECPAGVPA